MKEEHSDIFRYLISHSGFRSWVQAPDEESNYFWKKWIDEHPESIADINRAREFVLRLRFRETRLSAHELDALLGKVLSDESSVPEAGRRKVRGYLWQKAAAILLLGLSIWIFRGEPLSEVVIANSSPSSATVETPMPVAQAEEVVMHTAAGERTAVTLPDGSVVNISAGSTLKYPRVFGCDLRKVELVGEAFFQVVHDEAVPFVVEAGGVETRVLGTSFNIKTFEDGSETEISLVTGKIRVTRTGEGSNGEEKYLSPGQQLTYSRRTGEMVVKTFDVVATTAWKDGVLVFSDAGFEEFIQRLEKWYGVDFQVYGEPAFEWKINGRYRNETLEDILSGLKFIYGIDYRIQGKHVLLKFEPH